MLNLEERFRLRWNEKIVGYARKMGATTFYSPDQYAWSGNAIDFNLQDRFLNLHDINRRAIFANDIIEFKSPREDKFALILFDEVLSSFQLFSADGENLIDPNAKEYLQTHRFVWKSYVFIQNQV
jgi:hypothetical protein